MSSYYKYLHIVSHFIKRHKGIDEEEKEEETKPAFLRRWIFF